MNNATRTAIGIGIVFLMGLAGAQGILLVELDANNDLNPNDGWDFTGAISGTLPVDTTLGGSLARLTDGTQAYFHRTADDRFFNGGLSNSVAVADWTVEVWVRKDVTGEASVPEDQVVNFRDASFTEFITIGGASHATPIDEPDFDHRDFNGGTARSQIDNAFTWPEDTWQQWVATYRDSDPGADNGILTVYVNGAQVAQDSNQKPRHEGSSAFDTMGVFAYTSSDWNRGLSGDIAIIRLYDNILTPSEIASSYTTTAVDLGLIAPQGVTFTNVNLVDTIGMEFDSENLTEYTLQFTTDLVTSSAWMNAASVIGTGTNMFLFDPTEATGSSTGKAYRILSY